MTERGPGAVNGMGNALFCEVKFDQTIVHHERPIELAGGSYPAAGDDLDHLMRVIIGALPFAYGS